MNTRSSGRITLLALLLAGSCTASIAQAGEQIITVSKTISTAGVDFNDPRQVHALYRRLVAASSDVCGNRWRLGLDPVADPAACGERSLGKAVRELNKSQLTLVYLSEHTMLQAKQYGVPVPSTLASN